ncbi:hypothetical protein DPV79_24350 [Burkholderia reimsis]|uniref:Uncharacterized protein n=1 Tax=Burkholderia reimsis TaxID=2234132 RepID=A0A365QSF7_9BURK|nr:hypothetical protein DPV79_24350 [Burkholderia reimsis]
MIVFHYLVGRGRILDYLYVHLVPEYGRFSYPGHGPAVAGVFCSTFSYVGQFESIAVGWLRPEPIT